MALKFIPTVNEESDLNTSEDRYSKEAQMTSLKTPLHTGSLKPIKKEISAQRSNPTFMTSISKSLVTTHKPLMTNTSTILTTTNTATLKNTYPTYSSKMMANISIIPHTSDMKEFYLKKEPNGFDPKFIRSKTFIDNLYKLMKVRRKDDLTERKKEDE
uniref:Uncharacterized protein n=1 Tax=Heterorhabditis bacteriophora TaxID=37862 RepID=A0A1I7XCP6_HETBA